MSRQVQVPGAGMIALGVFIVAFVLLMLIGYSFLAALFFGLVVAAAVAIFFLIAGDRHEEKGEAAAARSAGTATTAAPLASSAPPVPEPAPSPEPAAPPEPEPEAAPAAAPDKAEPERLDAPREGGADDLKRIKGVGPKMEEALNRMGIFHLDQIASWGPAQVAWMDENLENFPGRVSRDDWVGQARHLAGGGETEFSRRVDGGDVYE